VSSPRFLIDWNHSANIPRYKSVLTIHSLYISFIPADMSPHAVQFTGPASIINLTALDICLVVLNHIHAVANCFHTKSHIHSDNAGTFLNKKNVPSVNATLSSISAQLFIVFCNHGVPHFVKFIGLSNFIWSNAQAGLASQPSGLVSVLNHGDK